MLGKRIVPIVLALLGACLITWYAVQDRVMWSMGARIAWHQDAVTASELSQLRWEIAVDGGEPAVLDATCTPVDGSDGYACEASLPPMTWGRHAIELRAWRRGETRSATPATRASAPSTMDVIVLPKLW